MGKIDDGTKKIACIVVALISVSAGLLLRATGEIEVTFTDIVYHVIVFIAAAYTILEIRAAGAPEGWKRLILDVITFLALYLGYAFIKAINTGEIIDWLLKFVFDGETVKLHPLNAADTKSVFITFLVTLCAYGVLI